MGIINIKYPQFLTGAKKGNLHKLMFIKRGGEAIHGLGDLTRDYLDAELICISDENEKYWIGNYAKGFGFVNVCFNKKDCRDATDEEVAEWIKNPDTFKF